MMGFVVEVFVYKHFSSSIQAASQTEGDRGNKSMNIFEALLLVLHINVFSFFQGSIKVTSWMLSRDLNSVNFSLHASCFFSFVCLLLLLLLFCCCFFGGLVEGEKLPKLFVKSICNIL